MALAIEPGRSYLDGWGKQHNVWGWTGETNDERRIAWTVGAFWFREDGRAMFGIEPRFPDPGDWDLRDEVTWPEFLIWTQRDAAGQWVPVDRETRHDPPA